MHVNNSFTENWLKLQDSITRATQRSGREAASVTLIGVTKTHPTETVDFALRSGLQHVGENKVQEARGKIEQIGARGIWHLVGHLQSNKAKLAAHLFDQVDSIDSLEIAQTLHQHAAELGKHLPVLLQVNVAGESQKFGLRPGETAAVAEAVNQLSSLELRGLMTIPPLAEEAEESRRYFRELRELRDQVEKETGLHLPELSMGMSHDYEIAIEEGSTQIRVGTSLFGTRQASRLSSSPSLD
jgi:pyridoxal phosphate enzyme (YggS family)